MPPKFSQEIKKKLIFPGAPDCQPRTSPCEAACPAGNPIQKSHALVHENRIEEALEYLRLRNPFPGITGRVCAHPCEQDCNRKSYDGAVSIRGLERFVADHADMGRSVKPRKRRSTGKRLAVIGSGPAGMTCAYFSALLGHEVTVFESSAVLGGMPRTGIPNFRLPKDVVDREIGQILGLGVRARTNTRVGQDISFERLRQDFDACLIAVGTWKEGFPDVPGARSALPALSFLKEANLGRREIGARVAVVGGGGVAFDCAFTARRLGASEVHIFCVEPEREMRVSEEDLAQAEAEGVSIHNSRMISRVLDSNGKAVGVEHYEIASFEFDERGRLSVQPLTMEKASLKVDAVIAAVGERPDFSFLDSRTLKMGPSGNLEVNPETWETSLEGVFAAGDAASGPSTVASAIGSGRSAAMAIDRYFSGAGNNRKISVGRDGEVLVEESEETLPAHVVSFEEILNIDHHPRTPRRSAAKGAPGEGVLSFGEIDKGFGETEAPAEAERCFHCGHCTSCGCCVEDCPGFVLEMTEEGPRVAHFDECWHCGCCRIACPSGAVYYEFPMNMMV